MQFTIPLEENPFCVVQQDLTAIGSAPTEMMSAESPLPCNTVDLVLSSPAVKTGYWVRRCLALISIVMIVFSYSLCSTDLSSPQALLPYPSAKDNPQQCLAFMQSFY